MQLPLYLMSWEERRSNAFLPTRRADLPGCSDAGQDGRNMDSNMTLVLGQPVRLGRMIPVMELLHYRPSKKGTCPV